MSRSSTSWNTSTVDVKYWDVFAFHKKIQAYPGGDVTILLSRRERHVGRFEREFESFY